MRWTKPEDGQIKIKSKFAIFPICIDDETRWLEWVRIKYVYHNGTLRRDWNTNQFYHIYGWRKEEFIDDGVKHKDELHSMHDLANEIMTKIYKDDQSGRLLYLFCKQLCAISKLKAYGIDDRYKLVVITEDEYKKLKTER